MRRGVGVGVGRGELCAAANLDPARLKLRGQARKMVRAGGLAPRGAHLDTAAPRWHAATPSKRGQRVVERTAGRWRGRKPAVEHPRARQRHAGQHEHAVHADERLPGLWVANTVSARGNVAMRSAAAGTPSPRALTLACPPSTAPRTLGASARPRPRRQPWEDGREGRARAHGLVRGVIVCRADAARREDERERRRQRLADSAMAARSSGATCTRCSATPCSRRRRARWCVLVSCVRRTEFRCE